MSRVVQLVISGFPSCPFYQNATKFSQNLPKNVSVRLVELPRDEFHAMRINTLKSLGKDENFHKTCPFVYTETEAGIPEAVIGGYDALRAAAF